MAVFFCEANSTVISAPASAQPQTGKGLSRWRTMLSLKMAGIFSSANTMEGPSDRTTVKKDAQQVFEFHQITSHRELKASFRNGAAGKLASLKSETGGLSYQA